MRIDHGTNFWGIDIHKMEKYYGSTYVGDFPVIEGNVMHTVPASVFYRPKEKVTPNNHQYFGMWKPDLDGYMSVFNASYVTEYIFNGLQMDKTIIYSRFEDDCRTFEGSDLDKSIPWIKGGWKSCEIGGDMTRAQKVRLQVQDGIITILPPKTA